MLTSRTDTSDRTTDANVEAGSQQDPARASTASAGKGAVSNDESRSSGNPSDTTLDVENTVNSSLLMPSKKQTTQKEATSSVPSQLRSSIPVVSAISRIPQCRPTSSIGMARVTSEHKDLSSQQDMQHTRSQSVEPELDVLRKKVTRFEKELAEKSSLLAAQTQHAEELQHQLDNLQRSTDDEVSSWKEKLSKAEAKCHELEAKCKSIELHPSDAESRNKSADGSSHENDKSACSLCTEKSAELISLKADKNQLDKQVLDLNEQVSLLRKGITSNFIDTENSASKSSMDVDAETDLFGALGDETPPPSFSTPPPTEVALPTLEELQKALAETQEELAISFTKFASATAENQMLGDEIKELKEAAQLVGSRISQLETEKTSLEQQVLILQRQSANYAGHVALMNEQNAAGLERLDQLNAALKERGAALTRVEDELSSACDERDEAVARVSILEKDLSLALAAKDELNRTAKAQLLKAEEYVKQREEESASAQSIVKEQVVILEKRVKDLENQIKSLNTIMEASRDENSVLRSTNEKIIESIEIAQAEVKAVIEARNAAQVAFKLAKRKEIKLEREKETLTFEKHEFASNEFVLKNAHTKLMEDFKALESSLFSTKEALARSEMNSSLSADCIADLEDKVHDLEQALEEAQAAKLQAEAAVHKTMEESKNSGGNMTDELKQELSHTKSLLEDANEKIGIMEHQLVESAAKLQKAEANLAEMENNLVALVREKELSQKQLDSMQTQIATLEKDCVILEVAGDQKTTALSNLESRLSRCVEERDSAKREVEEILVKSQVETKRLQVQCEQLERETELATKEKLSIEKECIKLRSISAQLVNQVSNAAKERQSLKSQIDSLTTSTGEFRLNLHSLSIDADERYGSNAELDRSRAASEDVHRRLEDSSKHDDQISNLQALLEAKETEIRNLTSQLEQTEELRAKWSQAVNDEQLLRSQLETRKLELENEISALSATITKHGETISEMNARMEQETASKLRTLDDFAVLKKDHAALIAKLSAADESLVVANKQIDEFQFKLSRSNIATESERLETSNRLSQMQATIQNLQCEKEAEMLRVEEMKEQLNRAEYLRSNLSDEVSSLRAAAEKFNGIEVALTQNAVQHEQTIIEINSRLEQEIELKLAALQESSVLKSEKAELTARLSTAAENLDTANKQIDELKSGLTEATGSVESITSRLSEYQNEVQQLTNEKESASVLIREMEQQHKDAIEKLRMHEERIEELSAMVQDLKTAAEQFETSKAALVQEADDSMERLAAVNLRLQQETELKLAALEETNTLSNERDDLTARLSLVNENLNEANKQIEAVKYEFEAATAEIESLRESLSEAEDEAQRLISERTKSSQHNLDMEQQMKDSKDKLHRHEERIESLSSELLSLQTAAENFEAIKTTMKQEAQDALNRVSELESKLESEQTRMQVEMERLDQLSKESQSQSDKLQELLTNDREELKVCQGALSLKEVELQSVTDLLHEVEAKCSELQESIKAKMDEALSAQQQLDAVKRENSENLVKSAEELSVLKHSFDEQADTIAHVREQLAEKETELKGLQIKIEQSEQVIASKTAKLELMQKELDESEAAANQMKELIESLGNELQESQTRSEGLTEKNQRLQKTVESLEDMKLDLLQDLDSKSGELKRRDVEIGQLQTELLQAQLNPEDISKYVEAISELKNDAEVKNATIKEFEKALILAQKLMDDHRVQVAEMSSALSDAESKSASLGKALADTESLLQLQNQRAADLEKDVTRLEASATELEKLRAELAEVDAARTILSTTCSDLSSELEAQNLRVVELSTTCSDLSAALEAQNSRVVELTAQFDGKVAEIESANASQANLEETIKMLESKLEDSESRLKSSTTENGDLEAKLEQLEMLKVSTSRMELEMQEKTEKMAALEHELSASKTAIESMQESLDAASKEMQSLKDEHESMAISLAEIAAKEEEISRLKAALEEQGEEVAAERKVSEQHQKSLTELQESLSKSIECTRELEEAKIKLEESLQEYKDRASNAEKDLCAKVADGESALASAKVALDEKTAELAALEITLTELNAKVEASVLATSEKTDANCIAHENSISALEAQIKKLETEIAAIQEENAKNMDEMKATLSTLTSNLTAAQKDLDEKTAFATECERVAQENDRQHQDVLETSMALNRENKKLLVQKQKLERSLEKLQRQMEEKASVSDASVTVADTEVTPKGSKRSAKFSKESGGPSKSQKVDEADTASNPSSAKRDKSAAPEPSVPAPSVGATSDSEVSAPAPAPPAARARRMTFAAKRTDQAADSKLTKKDDCKQQ
ncbi:hypothetical protein HDU77_006476 [Chytriomyces hyalinus]|nr:hypothetical protein HDU77_006476 [Chytriomyces hyalinus]